MTKLRKGDSVVVKPGVMDLDFDIDIGGWQGRITEIFSSSSRSKRRSLKCRCEGLSKWETV
jgi:hypothetical protein